MSTKGHPWSGLLISQSLNGLPVYSLSATEPGNIQWERIPFSIFSILHAHAGSMQSVPPWGRVNIALIPPCSSKGGAQSRGDKLTLDIWHVKAKGAYGVSGLWQQLLVYSRAVTLLTCMTEAIAYRRSGSRGSWMLLKGALGASVAVSEEQI